MVLSQPPVPGVLCCLHPENSRRVGGQWPLEGFDGNGVLEVLALVEVVALRVLQLPVKGEVVLLDLSDVFSFTNIDLLQACSPQVSGGNKGHVTQISEGKDTINRVP